MSINIVRAWKDATYRASLSAEEQALVPTNPAGAVELSEAELELVHGADGSRKKEDEVIINKLNFFTNGILCVNTRGVDVDIIAKVGILGKGSEEPTVCAVKQD